MKKKTPKKVERFFRRVVRGLEVREAKSLLLDYILHQSYCSKCEEDLKRIRKKYPKLNV